jgi:hypothetical protein
MNEETSMPDPLLTIRNNHAAACGDPPIVAAGESDRYVGYFENRFGEQWVFTYDRANGDAVLRGGDIGWNTNHAVVNGAVGDLILGEEEQAWLRACWLAASGRSVS